MDTKCSKTNAAQKLLVYSSNNLLIVLNLFIANLSALASTSSNKRLVNIT